MVGDGLVVAIGADRGRAFDARTGALLWRTEEIDDDGGGSALIRPDSVVYWGEENHDDGLVLSRMTGKVIGHSGIALPDPLPDRPSSLHLRGWTVTTTDDNAVVTSPDGRQWVQSVREDAANFDSGPPVADGSAIYWGLSDGSLFGLNTTTSNVRTVIKTLGLSPK